MSVSQRRRGDLVHEILQEREIGATLGFLLTLLPNMQTIYITDYNEHLHGAGNLRFIIDKVATASHASTTPSSSARPCSRLYEMTFPRSDEGGNGDNWDLGMHAPIFYLPSMRTIRASHLTGIRDEWSYPGLRSNIETFEMCSSKINIKSFDHYLKDITHLREFRYQTDGD